MSDSYHSESSESSEGSGEGIGEGIGGGNGGGDNDGGGNGGAAQGLNNTQNNRTEKKWKLMDTATMRILGKVSYSNPLCQGQALANIGVRVSF